MSIVYDSVKNHICQWLVANGKFTVKTAKAPDSSEALILLGGEYRSRTGDLLHAIQVFYILLKLLGCPAYIVQFVQLMCNWFKSALVVVTMYKMLPHPFAHLVLASLFQPTLPGGYWQYSGNSYLKFDIHYL